MGNKHWNLCHLLKYYLSRYSFAGGQCLNAHATQAKTLPSALANEETCDECDNFLSLFIL